MEISEVRVKLVNNLKERLKAFCSITLENDFVIRDLKIIDGANGTFVAMPSRKLADRCGGCGSKNHLRARFCNECGKPLGEPRTKRAGKRGKLHADIAHPINAACRERIQGLVIDAYNSEVEKSKLPGYKPVEMDVDLDLDSFEEHHIENEEDAVESTPVASAPAPANQNRKPRREEAEEEGGGYDDLIAELRRDAAARRETREPRESAAGGGRGVEPEESVTVRQRDESVATRQREKSLPAAPSFPPSPPRKPVEQPQEEPADEFGAGIL